MTETLTTGKWSGVERVVRKLAAEYERMAEHGGMRVRLMAVLDGRFHELNAAGRKRFFSPPQLGSGQPGTSGAARLITEALRFTPGLFVRAQTVFKRRRIEPLLRALCDPEPASCAPGSLVFLLDSYWGGVPVIAAAARAKEAGARLIFAVYDLIPVTHPHYMTTGLRVAFPRQVRRAMAIADGALAISQASAQELRRFLGERSRALPITHFRLGVDAPATIPAAAPNRDGFAYAMIGTVEPRKGHDVVLDAFEMRWVAGAACTLTIVGKLGWASAALQARLGNHPERGRRLTLIHDASDAAVAAILARTDAVIMASRVEGFGLPIIEALGADVPVIAADIAVFREIGGETLVYFDPEQPAALCDAMQRFEADPEPIRKRARAFGWVNWADSATESLAAMARLLADGRQPG